MAHAQFAEFTTPVVFISYLQVNRPEVHDIEPLDIPGVKLEETEVRHKDNFETVLYAHTISGVSNVTILFGSLDRQKLKGGIAHLCVCVRILHNFQAIYNTSSLQMS